MASQGIREQALRIDASDWLRRKDVQRWLRKVGVATWYAGDEGRGFWDAFVTYDHGEGSDAEQMPKWLWKQIRKRAKAAGMEYGVIWLSDTGY